MVSMQMVRDKAAIVGIGQTKFMKDSHRTELSLACESVKVAIEDAGLHPEDIDGMVKHYDDPTDELFVMRSLGINNLTYFGQSRWGTGGSSSMVLRAAIGIASGTVNNVVVYRSLNGASKRRASIRWRILGQVTSDESNQLAFYDPFGLMTSAGAMAMIVRRYMHEYKIERDQFGWIPVVCREHGAKNQGGLFYQNAITFKDYQKSDMIVEPIRALDCFPDTDSAVALVITSAERAKSLKQRPAYILVGAQSIMPGCDKMACYQRPDISRLPEVNNVGKQLFGQAGVAPKDIKVAQLDDSCAPLVPMQLEELGFCDYGEGTAFCNNGKRIRAGGQLALNTSGGSLGEGHIYGMNHITEAVRQIRGTSSSQVKNAELVLVASGAGGPASGLILRR